MSIFALTEKIKDKYNEIINNNFIGWPTDIRLNGFNIAGKVLDNNTDRISKLDLHPNKQGQEKLARFIYEKIDS